MERESDMKSRRRYLAPRLAWPRSCWPPARKRGSGSGSSGGKPQSGGIVTFAEQPGSPPTYIFPLYDGANSGNDNITYLQPLMWLPLYWFGHPDNAQATINYTQSMANKPVFSDGGRTVTMKLKHYKWSNGKPVTSRDLEFWMNLLLAEKNNSAAYVPGGWMDHVTGMSAPNPHTFVLKFNVTYNQHVPALQRPVDPAADPAGACGTRRRPPAPVGNYDQTKAGAEKVYNYLNKESMSLSTWDTNPLWQVVDGPWRLKPNTGFQVTGQMIMVPNKSYSGPDKPKISEFEELPFTSATAEFNALQSGSVDYGYVPTTEVGAIGGTSKSPGLHHQALVRVGADVHRDQLQQPQVRPAAEPALHPAGDAAPDQPARVHQGHPAQLRDADLRPGADVPGEQLPRPGRQHQPVPVQPVARRSSCSPRTAGRSRRAATATCTRPGTASSECGAGIASGTKLAIPAALHQRIPELQNEVQAMQSRLRPGRHRSCSCTRAPINTVLSEAYECIGKPTSDLPGQLDRAEHHRLARLHLRADLLPGRGQPVRLRRRHQRRQLLQQAGGRR